LIGTSLNADVVVGVAVFVVALSLLLFGMWRCNTRDRRPADASRALDEFLTDELLDRRAGPRGF
jgi:hypothetical protein